jgi:DeoR/GlpR family transcriptional regulator of sugar metabolism
MLNKLPPRERQIVDLLFEQGEMAVSELCEALP